jgi:chromosome partitioning protein
MNIITMASCRAGTGKTTLTAQLAAHACGHGRRCLVIAADPRGGFAQLNARRAAGALPLARLAPGLARQLAVAEILGYDWVLIDTLPAISFLVQDAIRAAALVIVPARPAFADLAAVRETAALVRCSRKSFAVVFNAAPVRCDDADAPVVAEARAWLDRQAIPAWSGQVSERPGYVLAAGEADARALSALEIAELWSMLERSVAAISALPAGAGEERRAA